MTDLPDAADLARFSEGFGQRFVLTIDAEEEFDWTRPIARSGHTVRSVARLARFQEFCEGEGVVPIYLIDYPVATSAAAAAILRDPLARGAAEIGLQLHPWVNPPHDEEVNEANSFAGNLPEALERAKFARLFAAIRENYGASPRIYRAGRYGAGPNTARILADHGVPIDSSVRALFDYSAAGGPDFARHPLVPYWADRDRRLLELPLTAVYSGVLRQLGEWLYPRLWRAPRLRGVLARLALLERIPLTPEGVTIEEALRGIDVALDMGLPLLVFSFHSPSLAPGFTPYVRSEDDLDRLYDWWRAVFAHLRRRGVGQARIEDIVGAIALA